MWRDEFKMNEFNSETQKHKLQLESTFLRRSYCIISAVNMLALFCCCVYGVSVMQWDV